MMYSYAYNNASIRCPLYQLSIILMSRKQHCIIGIPKYSKLYLNSDDVLFAVLLFKKNLVRFLDET